MAIRVLLSLYNGPRFKLDMTELRRLDADNLKDAIAVIHADARRPVREIHQWLNTLTGRVDFGHRFENLAYEYKIRGRCKRDGLRAVEPESIFIETKSD
ncbi:MAG: hypothetical protein OEX07_03335 [Gammaproteobacteria bacterium]|nr:hypothetical protein [Gammaproteobacteria bacterium]